jgi:hypothetical protein
MGDINRRQFISSALVLGASPFLGKEASAEGPSAWRHIREWNKDEVKKYSSWVERIYDVKREGSSHQKRAKINQIFMDDEMNLLNDSNFLEEGNAQLSNSDLNMLNGSNHCGSFPKLMYNYYAYRRGLPASTTKIKMERGGDIRYSHGNYPVEVISSLPFIGDFSDYIHAGMNGKGGWYNFVTGNFRTAPFLKDTDSVPIQIEKDFLIPGTMAYNANGHCLMVSKIDESGEVHFLDAHPDRTITFNQTLSALPLINSFNEDDPNLKRSFDGFRSLRFSKIENGEVRYFSNGEMEEFGFSIDQYKTMDKIRKSVNEGGLEINGRKVKTYPQFVMARLSRGKEGVIDFIERSSQELGNMFRERNEFVQEGWKQVLNNGPIVFPNDSSSENIYQAHGRWESWSSPSSDVDRKQKYNYVATRLEEMVESFPDKTQFDYGEFNSKEELIEGILETKNRKFGLEFIYYDSSDGENVPLSLLDIEERLFDLSFDPNHPPELRWGAPKNSYERNGMKLLSVPLNSGGGLNGLKAYELEQGLRFYPHRQEGPSSLDVSKNPSFPPFELIEQRLVKYLGR